MLLAWSTQIFVIIFWFITDCAVFYNIHEKWEHELISVQKSLKRISEHFSCRWLFLCINLCVCLFGVTNLWKYDNAFMLCLDIFSVDFLSCCIYVFVQCVPWKIITDILTTEFNLKDIKKDWGRYIGIHVILICLFFKENEHLNDHRIKKSCFNKFKWNIDIFSVYIVQHLLHKLIEFKNYYKKREYWNELKGKICNMLNCSIIKKIYNSKVDIKHDQLDSMVSINLTSISFFIWFFFIK